MTNPAQLAAFIRFQLSELGAQNAHHEFEHLARHAARARIYSNILPATGPVSAGGDGGRDFETFRTWVDATNVVGTTFPARASGERTVVFACSLEKQIDRKIRDDLAKIISTGGVDEIIYFCAANLPIAKRLQLVAEASNSRIGLQIFDGTAIAEWLAEPELFWIAQEYLQIPAEVAPQVIVDDEYLVHKASWKGRSALAVSHADFVSIKAGLRRATFDAEARPDLSFWLALMAPFLDAIAPRELQRAAEYEIAVANLRSRNDMTEQSPLVADFYSDVGAFLNTGELTNAVTLYTYAFGGYYLGRFRIEEEVLYRYRREIDEVLRSTLEIAVGPGHRAGLLFLRGMLEISPAVPGIRPDLAISNSLWKEMLDSAAQAPLYPLEVFADFLVQIIKQRGDDPELLALAARVDDMLGPRLGNLASGQKAIDRALSLLERDERPAAIRELQAAKVKWFSGERLAGSLRVLLILAEQYRLLGLAYAAKYYALAAAFVARYEAGEDVRALLPTALLELIDAEDSAGNSFGSLALLVLFLQVHVQHDEHPLDTAQHPRLQENLGRLAALLGLLKRGAPDSRAAIDELCNDWPAPLRDPIWASADEPGGFWNKGTWLEAWSGLQDAMLDRPFGDIGVERCIRWEAGGIRWAAVFSNDYRTTPTAEQFVAELQVISCAFAGRDLGIVPSSVTLELEVDVGSQIRFDAHADRKATYKLTLPAEDRGAEQIQEAVIAFAEILQTCSVLGPEQIMRSFDKTVLESIFVARPYAELYREFVPGDLFSEERRQSLQSLEPSTTFNSTAGFRVPWFDGPGPDFDEDRAVADAQNRYQKMLPSVRHTIVGLTQHAEVLSQLIAMHDAGAKDWEILSIIGNIALNHRLPVADDADIDELRQKWVEALDQAEAPDEALDPDVFSDMLLARYRDVYYGSFLASWGLSWPKSADRAGIEEFLVKRFRLRDVDVLHENIFAWPD